MVGEISVKVFVKSPTIIENKNFKASYSISSWSGLLDRNKLEWHSDLIKYLGISEDKLPVLSPYDNYEKELNKI